MNVIGMWKLVSAKGIDFTTFEPMWRPNEDLLAAGDDDMLKMMADALFEFQVGDSDDAKNDKEPFRLELKPDGTGKSFRNDLEIKVPDWSVEDGKVKLTEKFLGTIDYTGTLEGNRLSLFNDDPEKPITCQYVFEKES